MAGQAMLTVRHAVAHALDDVEPGERVLVACSGGPDSIALASATAWVCARSGVLAGAVIVDHQLQDDSAAIAERAAHLCREVGLDPVVIRAVSVGADGGLEMAARTARYTALDNIAHDLGAVAILLGHTREDQAETVLLGLARGSGARSLSGMASRDGLLRRPLLTVPRATVHEAATEVGVVWLDPHNADPRFARVRVRHLLDQLGEALGPGVVPGLARSAELLRDDADALDDWADAQFAALVTRASGDVSADVDALEALPRAIRTRLIRRMCITAGSPGADLTMDHVATVERLISAWHGQGASNLPGGVVAARAYGRLSISAAEQTGSDRAS